MRLFSLLPLALILHAQAPLYLGVLESSATTGSPNAVRVIFQYRNGRWQPIPGSPDALTPLPNVGQSCNSAEAKGCRFPKMGVGYPQSLSWTVAFDGKSLGELRTAQPRVYSRRSQLGIQLLTPDSKPPQVRAGAAGFNMGSHYRPLVVVTQPNFRDPDSWKPFHPEDPTLIKQLHAEYRALSTGHPKSECHCPDDAFPVQPKGYRSAHGDILVSISAEMRNGQLSCDCDGSLFDPFPDWFLVQNGHFRHIGQNLDLIDAGDYAATGASYVLFLEEGEGDGADVYVLLNPRTGAIVKSEIPNDDAH